MKITVIGATGLIGSKVVDLLEGDGHDVVAASRASGADVLTGEGLADAVAGADVLVDMTNSPSFDDDPVMDFFSRSSANLVAAAKQSGVGHYVALSIVGSDDLPQSGYMRAKVVQEKAIAESGLSYTIVRATQFFEFLNTIADSATVGDTVLLPPALIQPMAAADVAEGVAIAAVGAPMNGITEIGGPAPFPLDGVIRTVLTAHGDARRVVPDPEARYWGIAIEERTLIPAEGAALFDIRLADWILETAAKR